ncbi:MAG TPA: sugar ABC transporter permease [Nocardioidaceae bacterium]|nr:sugar ABC transporter permease [Nocardioidaceae bacterium]
MIKILNALIAIVLGVGGITVLYFVLNALVERLPGRWERRLKPFVFIGPAVLVVGLFLVYPAVQTVIYSFANDQSTAWVGFENYTSLFGDVGFRSALFNNLLWIVVVPTMAVIIGLLVAVLADKLGPRTESLSKSVIFLPMAISFVGAATIWGFIYDANLRGGEQVGLLNAIVVALGFDPVVWLQQSQWAINDLLLMVIMVWLQAGFAMVLLSAAIKNVPDDTIEAARIDGASETKIFFQVIVPQIWATVLVVFTTVLILVMKIFDIVYVMTNGAFDTEVIANTFFKQLFEFGNNGRAAAVVVVLMIAVIPLMVYQVRRFRAEEAGR